MRPLTPGRRRAAVLALLAGHVAVAGVFALATLTTVLPAGGRRPVADLLLAAAALGTGVVMVRASRSGDPTTHRAWRSAAAAVLAWGSGQLAFAVEHLVTGDVRRPGLSDVGYTVAVVFAVRAALAFPTVASTRTGRSRAVLDGSVVAGCALLLTWLFVLAAPGDDGSAADGFGLLLAYPLLDCAIITVLVGAAIRLPREHAVSMSLALGGVVVLLVTNLVTFSLGRTGALSSPEPAEGGFLLCFALLGTGVLLQSRRATPQGRATSLAQQLLPYAGVPPVVLALLLHPERLTPGSVALTVVLALLLILRQVVVVAENDQLNARLLGRARRYEALVQGSADLTLVLDPAGTVTDASPSVHRLLGDVRGLRWTDVVAADDAPALALDLHRCRGLADGVTTRFRFVLPGGDVHVDARLTDLTGRPEVGGVVVNARDVTDHHRAQRALADSERRYRQMVETAAEALAVSDGDGVLRFGNRRLAEVLGQPLEQLVGRPEREVMEQVLDGPGLALLEAQNAERVDGRSSTYELTVTPPDGSTRHVRIAATPLTGTDGGPDGSMALITDVTAQVELERRLTEEAVTDHLTGLGNRRALVEGVPARLAGRPLALLYVDLDDFKAVNDSAGHATGDALLRTVATRLRACLRDEDLVVRLGGDEFAAVLVDEADTERAVHVAQRVLDALREPVELGGRRLRPAASIGVALSPAGAPDPVASLLRDADAALYAAKAGGRGRVCTASGPVEPLAHEPGSPVELSARRHA